MTAGWPDLPRPHDRSGHADRRQAQPPAADLDHVEEDVDLLRPFVLTGGRTRPDLPGLRVEAQVRTRPEAVRAGLRFEAGRIAVACRHPRSIAELAVLLGLPLGVVRILVADLVAAQLLTIEEPSEISVALLERILDGVRAL